MQSKNFSVLNMLEDFIKANSLKAKILQEQSRSSLVKCRIYIADENPVLIIAFSDKKISEDKIKKELNCSEIKIPDENKALEITGYEKQYIPPISVYGVNVLLDKSLLNKQELHCNISRTHSLEISSDEIQETNEDIVIGEYCR